MSVNTSILILKIFRYCTMFIHCSFMVRLSSPSHPIANYRIVGNFGEGFNVAIWQRSPKLANFRLMVGVPMTLSIWIAKFRFCQYQLTAMLPYITLRGQARKEQVSETSQFK